MMKKRTFLLLMAGLLVLVLGACSQKEKQEAKERCEWWLSKVGLDASVWKKYRHELSGGQLQRLVLARMMAVGAELVLFDEPTSGQDGTETKELLVFMDG